MAKTFILHDESLNTYGFYLRTSGCDLTEFRRNPVMFYNHETYHTPIGRWENIRIEGNKILADAVFDEADPEAKKIADKVERGFIRMASIGTWPPEETSSLPEDMKPGQTQPTVTRWTLREASIVAIGANHNALAFFDRTTGERIDLADEEACIKLMDGAPSKLTNQPNATNPTNNDIDMSKINQLLGLKDEAGSTEQTEALEAMTNKLQEQEETIKQLEADKAALLEAQAKADKERKAAEQAEAKELLDKAVQEGRITAQARESFVALFDRDHQAAKLALEGIPKPISLADEIDKSKETPELSDTPSPWERRMAEIRARAEAQDR